MRTPSDSSRCRENSPSTKPGAIQFDPCGLFIHHDDQGPIIELGQLDETADEWVTRAALRALPAHVAQPLESAGA